MAGGFKEVATTDVDMVLIVLGGGGDLVCETMGSEFYGDDGQRIWFVRDRVGLKVANGPVFGGWELISVPPERFS
jgi:hypothetical protein